MKEEKMPEKDPTTYSLITYLWVFGLSALGGVVNFFRKVKAGVARTFNFAELIGELVTSAFAGIITFWFCELADFRPLLTAGLVGISGHMGSRAIFHLEGFFTSRFPPPSNIVTPGDKPK